MVKRAEITKNFQEYFLSLLAVTVVIFCCCLEAFTALTVTPVTFCFTPLIYFHIARFLSAQCVCKEQSKEVDSVKL